LIRFLLNNQEINTPLPASTTLLDFIRYKQRLMGTKIGCREGDCGACTVMVGECKNNIVSYHAVTSCLMPLGNAHGKHIITIEGINMSELTGVQDAFAKEGATQCGFCTPGFIISLTCFCLTEQTGQQAAIDAMNGNICRCTGYKSIERAAQRIVTIINNRKSKTPVQYAIEQKLVPAYLADVPSILSSWNNQRLSAAGKAKRVGGGTDIYVQMHDTISEEEIELLYEDENLKGIEQNDDELRIGGAVTVSNLYNSQLFQQAFPGYDYYLRLVSSTPIRNMATIAGNFTNASPIGDLSVFFLSLNTRLVLIEDGKRREMALKDFFVDYKVLGKRTDEIIEKIIFKIPSAHSLFNFEKVSKRTHLDIASVNSAMLLTLKDQDIASAQLSAGGVAPIPLYLKKTSAWLEGKKISAQLVKETIAHAQQEISPISDARGTAEYKTLLLGQLIKAHFVKMFPNLPLAQILS